MDQLLQTKNASMNSRQISILSWNILAQKFLQKTPHLYSHVSRTSSIWGNRLNLILREISQAEADIICLQEVEFQAFEEDLLPYMTTLGYSGILQNAAKNQRSSGHSIGVATFWKTNRFALDKVSHRSRTMITTFRDSSPAPYQGDDDTRRRTEEDEHVLASNNQIIAVVNAHLEGAPWKTINRLKQLQNTFKDLDSKFDFHDLIICGDMNCELQNSACTTYLQHGSCMKDMNIIEFGEPVKSEEVYDILPHSFSMHSVYPMDSGKEYTTFISGPGQNTIGIDQIWYHNSKTADDDSVSRVVSIRRPYRSSDDFQEMMKSGLPNSFHGSDHLPVGCVLEWKHVQINKLRESRLIPTTTSEDKREKKRQKVSKKELLEKVDELTRNKLQFENEHQKLEFEYVIRSIERTPIGRPTPAQIEQLNDQKRRRIELVNSLPLQSTRAAMKEIFQLSKKIAAMKKDKIMTE